MNFYISHKLSKFFKGFCFPPAVIMACVYQKCKFSLSYRDIEELCAMRGIKVDHATLHRWMLRFAPLILKLVQIRKKPSGKSWRMYETYVKVKGAWYYLYRAIDSAGNTVDFLLRKHRDAAAAKAFFRKAFKSSGMPEKVNIDKSGSNTAALTAANEQLPQGKKIKVRQVKYLNNLIEQDHRFIKKRVKTMLGFKDVNAAKRTIAGIEAVHMIRKRQIAETPDNFSTFETFKMLMAG